MLDSANLDTHYAKSGELSIAYQEYGTGELRLVLIPGWASNVENIWTVPEFAAFAESLAQFARVIHLDRRGTGLSDPVPNPPTLEERMDDVRAVIDAAGWQRAVIWGISEGGPMAMMFAATYPDRVQALLLYGTFARFSRADDYPHGFPPEFSERWLSALESSWGTGELSRSFAPSLAGDPHEMRLLARLERMAMSPGTARKLFRVLTQLDVRHVLPAIRVPTLVLHRTGDQPVRVAHGRYLAEHISGAKYVELPGADHMAWVGDVRALLVEVRQFLTGERAAPEVDRMLATVMLTDIVGSTERVAAMGDRRWKDLLERHNDAVRRELARFRGREVKSTGDGFLATFDGPGRAIQCAQAIADAARKLGIEVRGGLHTGECELLAQDIGGIAVHVAARVAAKAGPGEVLVSRMVKDLVAGSAIRFEPRGTHMLKGVPGRFALFAAVAG
jgi:pimeloyl-ACP methyl ester carboxylesterase